jgi:leucyl aminopeptidase
MQVSLKQGSPGRLRMPLLCIPLFEGEKLHGGLLADLDAACGGLLAAVERSGDFTGKLWSHVLLYNPSEAGPRRILLLGVGKPDQMDLERVRQAACRAVRRAGEMGTTQIAILFPTRSHFDAGALAQALTEGAVLGDYRYEQYVTTRENGARHVQEVTLLCTREVDTAAAHKGIEVGLVLSDVVCKVRDMVNAPANEITPTEMANRATASAKEYGYQAEVFERSDIKKLGMGGLIAVSQGSDQPPRFIVVEHEGTDRKSRPLIVVGKGLTFDAGGICLKPPLKMDEMKGDMAGGAAALGIVEAAARLRLPTRVIGLVPATENLLGASAYRPGDILKMLNGKTVFVDNTDAEGRIILGDALAYGQRYQPRAFVDLATLTGAALVALGQVATAVLGNDRELTQKLIDAGQRCFERLWELPLWEEFEELIKSPIADIKNSGGKNGGTITAAAFLKHFVGTTPWAHLDIAGTAYLDKAEGYRPAGGTGVGVRLLIEYLVGENSAGAPLKPWVGKEQAPARSSHNGRGGVRSRSRAGSRRRARA